MLLHTSFKNILYCSFLCFLYFRILETKKEAKTKKKEEVTIEAQLKTCASSQTRSTTSSKQVQLGGFGYEEEIIETYEYTEDRPILTTQARKINDVDEDDHDCFLTFDIPMVTSESLSSILKSPDEVSVTSSTNTGDDYSQCSDRDSSRKEFSRSYAPYYATTPSSAVAVCEERSITMVQ